MAIDSRQPQQVNIASTPVVGKPLTDEERKKRYERLRQQAFIGRLRVTSPPGKTGYWARKNDTGELSRLEYLGFSVVHDNPAQPRWKAAGAQQDGTYCLGDVILMEIESDLYEDLLRLNEERAKDLISSPKEFFKDECEGRTDYPIPTFERSIKPPTTIKRT